MLKCNSSPFNFYLDSSKHYSVFSHMIYSTTILSLY
nr:MAG TPA: hypothetical protein [Caudoviricetes sp.]